MKNLKKLSLQKEVKKEAEQIEKEVSSHTELDDLKVSDEMETSLFNKIQEYEYDKRFKVVYHRKKKRHYLIIALAAVLVIVAGSAMTGVGSKSYWKVVWEKFTGGESLGYIDVENMESQETEDLDEVGVYREINQKFGITPVRLGYKLPRMSLKKYSLDENQGRVSMFYEYNNEIIRYSIYTNNSDSSFAQKDLDSLVDKYEIEKNGIKISIEVYSIENYADRRYVAEFEYQNIQYQLKGIMKKEEFEKLIDNLVFL